MNLSLELLKSLPPIFNALDSLIENYGVYLYLSCGIATQLPGNSRATAAAMPPDGRRDDSQDNLLCAAQQPRRNPCNGQDSILQDDSPEIPAFNHDIQKL